MFTNRQMQIKTVNRQMGFETIIYVGKVHNAMQKKKKPKGTER